MIEARNVPENVMHWMVIGRWQIVDVQTDNTTVPPTYYFTMQLGEDGGAETRITMQDVPESAEHWMIAQGFEIIDVKVDDTTVPPSRSFVMRLQTRCNKV